MKKTLVIPILFILLINCVQGNREHKKLKNEKSEQNFWSYRLVENKFIEFDIDTLKNFREITRIIEGIDCKKNYAVFKLETDEKIFKIQPLQFCEDIFDYKFREIIYINTDSITVNEKLRFPIDSLNMILNYHLNNPKDDKDYPLKDEKRLISVNVDSTKNIVETKNLLLNIVSHINELNTKSNFSFIFEDWVLIKVIEE